MTRDVVDAIARAVLYEGYLLYPYRPSSLKNQQRWTFGGVFPRAYAERGGGDPWSVQTEGLVRGSDRTVISAALRFLQIARREGRGAAPPWDEAVEREIATQPRSLGELAQSASPINFEIPESRDAEDVASGRVLRTTQALAGAIEMSAEPAAEGVHRLTVRVRNLTEPAAEGLASREAAQPWALASAHLVLRVEGGGFVSLTDPPEELREAAAACRNEGLWPVLAGVEPAADTLLAAPIILPDYPQIAPESPGDLFDGCEIDEILTLRILTMTDQEKQEMAAADPRARALLARTEALGEAELSALHGALRHRGTAPSLASIIADRRRLSVGDRVRLRPKGRADAMDVVLAGLDATIVGLERDFEDRIHVAVTIDDDPGRDLGSERFPGHRFFFAPEEVELRPTEPPG